MDVIEYNGKQYNFNTLSELPKGINPRYMSEITDADTLVFGGVCSCFHPLCNWFKCKLKYNSFDYNCLEQGYHHRKARRYKDNHAAELILQTDDPAEQKRIGKTVRGFDSADWESVRDRIMTELLSAKFGQNPELLTVLLDTGNKVLVEAGLNDKHFATGLKFGRDNLDSNKWHGDNALGGMLTNLRAAFRTSDSDGTHEEDEED